ncbi:TfuA-like protein [Dickeya fangzhongdai]|uniref:TfuA-like protein n=1 Tax=Dickeya fangzhongdai TaxID=1778540 RepID=UPI0009078D0B|nr:TfuA-like protein [Dickeya fangzhongdai]
MLFSPKRKPIVFGGPSVSTIKQRDDIIEYRPPIQGGELAALTGSGRPVLIVDGLFGTKMSVTVVECLEFIQAGGLLLGCSSMGALRAADCYTAGMVGVGQIFQGYIMGYYHSDADVALRYHSGSYEEITLSWVHIDHITRHLVMQKQFSSLTARLILAKVRSISWYERYIDRVVAIIRSFSPQIKDSELRALFSDDTLHPKKNDAQLAINYLTQFYLARREQ